MARITPDSGGDYESLVDGDWYNLTLSEIVPTADLPAEEKKFGPTTRFAFKVDGHPEVGSLRVYASNTLNDAPGGLPNKLRQVLNALNGKTAATPIKELDDETIEVVYESGSLTPAVGTTIQASGTRSEKGFKLDRFRALASGGSVAQPVAVAANGDRTPVSAIPF